MRRKVVWLTVPLVPLIAFIIFWCSNGFWSLSPRDRGFHAELRKSDNLSVTVHWYDINQPVDQEPLPYDALDPQAIGSFGWTQFAALLPVETQATGHAKGTEGRWGGMEAQFVFNYSGESAGMVVCYPDGGCEFWKNGDGYLLTSRSAQRFRAFLRPLLKAGKVQFK